MGDTDWTVVLIVVTAFVAWPALYLIFVWWNHTAGPSPETDDYADPDPPHPKEGP